MFTQEGEGPGGGNKCTYYGGKIFEEREWREGGGGYWLKEGDLHANSHYSRNY